MPTVQTLDTVYYLKEGLFDEFNSTPNHYGSAHIIYEKLRQYRNNFMEIDLLIHSGYIK